MKLSFNQRMILTLYPKFYGIKYQCGVAQKEVTQEHINVQKMCYLLKRFDIPVGSYGYSWDTYGPFSPGLQVTLHDLDMKGEDVDAYYDENTELFSEEECDKINRLIDILQLAEHDDERGRWMELLGSIAFLSYSVLPGEDFACVNHELVTRKEYFNDEDKDREAWNILENAGMLKLYK